MALEVHFAYPVPGRTPRKACRAGSPIGSGAKLSSNPDEGTCRMCRRQLPEHKMPMKPPGILTKTLLQVVVEALVRGNRGAAVGYVRLHARETVPAAEGLVGVVERLMAITLAPKD